jgi:hypothetical protein
MQNKEMIGRNDPCHCGSGKKYKKCCLEKDIEEAREAKRYKPPPRDPNAPKLSLGIFSAIAGGLLASMPMRRR